MLKAVIKRSSRTEGADDSIRHRLVPDDAVKATLARLEELKDEVSEVLKEEKEEKRGASTLSTLYVGSNPVRA